MLEFIVFHFNHKHTISKTFHERLNTPGPVFTFGLNEQKDNQAQSWAPRTDHDIKIFQNEDFSNQMT